MLFTRCNQHGIRQLVKSLVYPSIAVTAIPKPMSPCGRPRPVHLRQGGSLSMRSGTGSIRLTQIVHSRIFMRQLIRGPIPSVRCLSFSSRDQLLEVIFPCLHSRGKVSLEVWELGLGQVILRQLQAEGFGVKLNVATHVDPVESNHYLS